MFSNSVVELWVVKCDSYADASAGLNAKFHAAPYQLHSMNDLRFSDSKHMLDLVEDNGECSLAEIRE